MKFVYLVAAAALAMPTLASAEGDAAAGEDLFKRCKSCHMITAADGTAIQKGGRTGPNLFGVIGRVAGTDEDFGKKYSKSTVAAGEAGLVWDEEQLAVYLEDPTAYLKAYLEDDSAKSRMVFKLKKGGADIAAYLASVGPES